MSVAQHVGLHAEKPANLLRHDPLIEAPATHQEHRLEPAEIVARSRPVLCRQHRPLGMGGGGAGDRRGHRPDERLETLIRGRDAQQEMKDSFIDPQRTPEQAVPGT